jgi:hypothetical protein
VALLIDVEKKTEEVVSSMGFRIFRDPASFKEYVLLSLMNWPPNIRFVR